MKITVAICTWNRAELLDKTLVQMSKMQIPTEVDWELLIVNNNCTDNTDDVIESHRAALPLRRLFEPMPGLSNARNCAVCGATGDLLVFTDDDILVDPGWLKAYADAMRQHPECSVFGGPIEPWFDVHPPTWFERVFPQIGVAFGLRRFGDQSVPLSKAVLPFGANFAIRRELLHGKSFDPELGVSPTRRMGGEETTLIMSLLANGHHGLWLPNASIQHYVRPDQMNLRFLRGYFVAQGEFAARGFDATVVPRLFGRPRWLWRQAITFELQYQFHRRCRRPEVWIKSFVEASLAWGQLSGCSK